MRQGVVLVGDTFTGKSKTIKAVRNLLNKKLLPLFEEFYNSKSEEKVKQDDQSRKPKESESNMRLFKAYLNTI